MLLVTQAPVRRLRSMRARVAGISLVIGLAMAMIVSGAYGGAVLDESVAVYLEEGRMPDLFMQLNGPHGALDIEVALANVPGVQASSLEQHAVGRSVTSGNESIQVNLVGVSNPGRADISKLELMQGRFFVSAGEALAIAGLESKGFGVSDTVAVQLGADMVELTIVGVVRGAEYVYTSAFPGYIVPGVGSAAILIVPMGTIPSLAPDEVNQVNVLLHEGEDGLAVMATLQPFGVVSAVEQKDHPSTVFISLGAQKLKTMMPIIGFIFMIVGFVAVFMTMARLVLSDTRYVGVLMSLGFRKRKIAGGYLGMGAVLALVGILIGVPLALLMTFGFVQAVVGLFFQVDIAFPFDPLPFLLGMLSVVLAVLLAISIPVAMVTKRTVREALEYRPDDRVRATRLSLGNRSMIAVMGLRNALRRPMRTAATVLVIVMTIGLAGSWLIMSDSALGYIDEQIAADTWDLRVELSTAVSSDSIDASYLGLDAQDSIYIHPASQVRAILRQGASTSTAALLATDDWGSLRQMSLLDGRLDFTGLVITKDLAEELGLDVGGEVEASLGSSSMTVRITGIVSDVMSALGFTSPGTLAPLFPADLSNLAFVALQQPSLAVEKAADVRTTSSVSSVLVHSDLDESMSEMVGLAIGMLYAFFTMSMIITVVVTGVAIMVSTMERDMEFATLSTLGASRREVAKGILVEMMVLAGISGLLAVPASYLISSVMAQAMSQAVFYFPVSISVKGTIAMVALGLLLVVFSAWIPIRYAKRLHIDRTLRERNAG